MTHLQLNNEFVVMTIIIHQAECESHIGGVSGMTKRDVR